MNLNGLVTIYIWAQKKRLWLGHRPFFSTRTCVNEAATSERTYTMALAVFQHISRISPITKVRSVPGKTISDSANFLPILLAKVKL